MQHDTEELISMEDATPEQMEQEIINISNQTLRNLGIQYVITRAEALHGDRFYLAVFAEIFRNIDFNQIEPSDTPEGQAQNIQALIDILERYVLDIDLQEVKGSEIVKGNQRQILELLLLIHEISDLVNRELDEEGVPPEEGGAQPDYPPEQFAEGGQDPSYLKQSGEKPEPKNFIFPDPEEFDDEEAEEAGQEGLDELRREVMDDQDESGRVGGGEMKQPPQEYYMGQEEMEEGGLIDNLPPGEEDLHHHQQQGKFNEGFDKKLKERGFVQPSAYLQQLMEQEQRDVGPDFSAEAAGSSSLSDRAKMRYDRPSNVPRDMNRAGGNLNLTDSSPPGTTHHLEELLDGVRPEEEAQEVPEEIEYKGRLPQAHAFRNQYANDMSDGGDETTQLPKHSSAMQQSRGAKPGVHEFDFYHAPEDQMGMQHEEQDIELEVQRPGKEMEADEARFEGRRLSHSKSNKNLIDSSGGAGAVDDSMASEPRPGTYPHMKPRGYEEHGPPPIIEPHTHIDQEQISGNIPTDYPPPHPEKQLRPQTAGKRGSIKPKKKGSSKRQVKTEAQQRQAQQQEILKERNRSYENVYNILTDNLLRAKTKLQSISEVVFPEDDEEFKDKIARDQAKIELMRRNKIKEIKIKSQQYMRQVKLNQQSIRREQKIQTIRERQLEDRLRNQQKSQMLKRNAQQVRMCHRIYKKASELEKERLVQEKKDYLAYRRVQNEEKRIIFDSIRNAYMDRIDMMKEKIHVERFERKIAQQARNSALKEMERQLRDHKRMEIEEYLKILRQEDERYDFENNNLEKFEDQLVQIYKRR